MLVFVGMREAPYVGTGNLFTNTAFALGQRKERAGADRRTFRKHNNIHPAAWHSGVAGGGSRKGGWCGRPQEAEGKGRQNEQKNK